MTERSYAGQSLLITGGTGSFGRAFAAHALAEGARRVVIYARGEAQMARMEADLADPRLRFFTGDVRDAERLREACRDVQVVIHAAALKRVDVCEREPREAVATNVLGTQQVAQACIANQVPRCLFLSTDKACAPETFYGTTKVAAERLWLQSNVYAAGTPTRFSATRYGNVLGSTGSVLTIWRRQYAAGEPLTITDPWATRFWMRMADAVALVDAALGAMRGGEVFLPKIQASSLLTLARAVVEGDGTYAPGHVTTGLGPGEKRHEMLLTELEARTTHELDDYYVIEPPARTWAALPPLAAPHVDGDFTYNSDGAATLTVAGLQGMIA